MRWAIFFLALAVLNEIIWRTQTTDFWVNFKVFGVVPITFVFAALQYPLLQKYRDDEGGKVAATCVFACGPAWLLQRAPCGFAACGRARRLRDEIGRLQHAEPERRRHREAERHQQRVPEIGASHISMSRCSTGT